MRLACRAALFLHSSSRVAFARVHWRSLTHETNQENEGPLPIAGRGRTKQRQNLAGQKITASIGFKSSIGASTLEALPEVVVVLYTG
jgi:hypothetical protein